MHHKMKFSYAHLSQRTVHNEPFGVEIKQQKKNFLVIYIEMFILLYSFSGWDCVAVSVFCCVGCSYKIVNHKFDP